MKHISTYTDIIQYNYNFHLVEFPSFGYTLEHIDQKNKIMSTSFPNLSVLPLDHKIFRDWNKEWRSEVFNDFFEFCSVGTSRHVVCTNVNNLLNFDYLKYLKSYKKIKSSVQIESDMVFRLDLLFKFNIMSISSFLGISENKLKNKDFIIRGAINRLNQKINHETSK